jgi:spermidine/putrescine-binding protein
VPIDTGYVGIAYRKDFVDEPITSRANFWELTPSPLGARWTSPATTGQRSARLCSALLFKGFSFDSTNAEELAAARDEIGDQANDSRVQ